MKKKRIAIGIWLALVLLLPGRVMGQEAEAAPEEKTEATDMEASDYMEAIFEELRLEELDAYVKEELPQKITFSDMVVQISDEGLDSLDAETIGTWIFDLFFYEISAAKPLFIQMLMLATLFAVINRFFVQKKGYVMDMSFFVVYGAMMLLLMQSFLLVSEVVEDGVQEVCTFLSTLVPAYASTLLLSGNVSSAGCFYELAFGLICLLEWAMKVLFIPGIHIFVLLVLLDHLFEEERFTRLAELLEGGMRALLKVSVGGVFGLGVVQSLLTPARDRISQSTVLKSLSVLPGVGNSFHFAEEVVLGCGMLVKNSVGIAGLVILVVLCLTPIVKVLSFHFLYKVLAAVLQPVADKRIAGCVQGISKASGLYLRLMTDTMLMFVVTISMVTASTSFVY